MKVVALLNEKGGSGKTTISLNLATAVDKLWVSCGYVDKQAALNSRIQGDFDDFSLDCCS